MATIRKINKGDFKAIGVDDQDAVVFSVANGYIAEVSDNAAAYLCTHDTFVSLDGDTKEDSKAAEKKITAWGGQQPDTPPPASGNVSAGAPTTVGGATATTPGAGGAGPTTTT
jgi:hypothetical protein